MSTEQEARLLLTDLFRWIPGEVRRWLEPYGGSAAAFLNRGSSAFEGLMSAEQAARLLEARDAGRAECICRQTKTLGGRLAFPGDDEFPQILLEIPDPPLVLFLRGKPLSCNRPTLAIVGSRTASAAGKALARGHAAAVARAGGIVVSGLARGIDSAAHLGALDERGNTLAVLGCGLDVVYPRENASLYQRICESGTLISEHPPGTGPLARNFPLRNRIISGLSQAVLVVEAREQSGSLITAATALDQNRSVLAVPGRPADIQARGCNRLIQAGARMVLDSVDCLEELGLEFIPARDSGGSVPETPWELEVLQFVKTDPVHVDALAEKMSAAGRPQLPLTLLHLEMSKKITRLPGDFVVRAP